MLFQHFIVQSKLTRLPKNDVAVLLHERRSVGVYITQSANETSSVGVYMTQSANTFLDSMHWFLIGCLGAHREALMD